MDTAVNPIVFGVVMIAFGIVGRQIEQIVQFAVGMHHTPGSVHRDANGRIPVGKTRSRTAVLRGIRVFGTVLIAGGALVIVAFGITGYRETS